ncbi:hypothetical protein UFOVP242_217 [uncultured Caudovirales phage]|uniref:Uncharacterized protein n=1 Tax=uncultured Caudovirales phage TaxID=2100421 RepID=A0A6J7X3Z7_9CAUD|nr:hypothetical protein UFOVP242_217 [uncultured Caudovirales phage]
MTEREALKIALEALEEQVRMANGWQSPAEAKAITAIKKALAQPEHDYKDLYEKEKRKSAMWFSKYEEVAGPAPKAIPMAQPEQDLWAGATIDERWYITRQPEQRNVTKQEHDVLMNSIKASSTVVSKGFLAQPEQEPEAFEEWLANQHGDPEEIGFLQALRIAYISGQDSITAPPQRKPEQDLVPLRMEWEKGYPEDVAFGTQRQMDRLKKWLDKYFALIQAQPEQEPVAWRHDMGEENGGWEYFEQASCPDCQPLYTTPPQRKPLTDEEIDRIWVTHIFIQATDRRQQAFARAIEAAHGIKE